MRGKSWGFTLMELLIVIVIIGILAALLVPTVNRIIRTVKEGTTRTMISNLEVAIEAYAKVYGAPPSDEGNTPFETWPLVRALKGLGTHRSPFHHFKEEELEDIGDDRQNIINPVYGLDSGEYLHYKENFSKNYRKVKREGDELVQVYPIEELMKMLPTESKTITVDGEKVTVWGLRNADTYEIWAKDGSGKDFGINNWGRPEDDPETD
jgi:prepilin-type N-terminal cleavage/methylation domain-containing protein